MNMKLTLFSYILEIRKKDDTLQKRAVQAKKAQALEKIRNAVYQIEIENIKYSEYRLSKISKCSINTIKKYRSEIEVYRREVQEFKSSNSSSFLDDLTYIMHDLSNK